MVTGIHLSPAQSCHFKEPESHVRTWLCSQTGILPSQYTNLAVDKVVSPHADSVSPEYVSPEFIIPNIYS